MTVTTYPRIFAYCASSFGLGHERRTLRVLSELARRIPEAEFLMASGAPLTLTEGVPDRLDLLLLAPKRRDPVAKEARVARLRDAIESFQPELIYIDEEPAGNEGEMRPALEAAWEMRPRPWIVSGLRDIANAPAIARSYWRAHRHDSIAERFFDYLLVFGDPDLFDPRREYQWSETLAGKCLMCGYLRPAEPLTPPNQLRAELGVGDRPLVVITAGGGQDGSTLIRTGIDALNQPKLADVYGFVVTGPLMSQATSKRFSASESRTGLTVAHFCPNLPSYLNAADLVVSMAGANTVGEIVALGKRAVVVPRKHQEQELRARLFAERGLVQSIPMTDLTPERLAGAIEAGLATGSPVNDLDFSGLTNAGNLFQQLLRPQFTPFEASPRTTAG